MVKNRETVTKTEWAPNHFSWPMKDDPQLSIKLEEIPKGGMSESHYHKKACQFFFIVDGEAFMLIGTHQYNLKKFEGLEIPPGKSHQIRNQGDKNLIFCLISSPRVDKDDIF